MVMVLVDDVFVEDLTKRQMSWKHSFHVWKRQTAKEYIYLKAPPWNKMEYTPESQIDAPKRISFARLPMEAEIRTRWVPWGGLGQSSAMSWKASVQNT